MAEALEASEHRLESGLLGEAFDTLDRSGWSVLDLGPATPTTVDFYAGYRCRVGFADALDAMAAIGRDESAPSDSVRARVADAVPVDPERPWRLVLLWDLLDYLPAGVLGHLGDRLKQGVAAGGLVHGFVTDGPQTVPSRPAIYQLVDRNAFHRWVDPASSRCSPPRYSAWHLQHYMPGFSQATSRQRRDARQEHLLCLDS